MKVFLAGWFGAGNLGDEAILLAELLLLRQEWGDIEFHVLSFDPLRTKALTAGIPQVRAIVRMGSRQDLFRSDLIGIWRAIREVDAVIIGGGGLFQDLYNHYPIPFFTALAMLARRQRKPLLFFALGIGPLATAFGRQLCRRAAEAADLITVRDGESREMLKRLGIVKTVHVCADPVFCIDPACTATVRAILRSFSPPASGPALGICLHDLLRAPNRQWRSLAAVLDRLVGSLGARVFLIPFGGYRNRWFARAGSLPADTRASRKAAGFMCEESRIVTEALSPPEAAALLERMDLVISMRLHGLVMALARGVPVIALTHARETKLRGLMRRIHLEDCVFDLDRLDGERLERKVLMRLEAEDILLAQNERVLSLKREARRCGSLVRQALLAPAAGPGG